MQHKQPIVKLNRTLSRTIFFSLLGVLVFLGFFLMILLHGWFFVDKLQNDFTINAWIKDEASKREIQQLSEGFREKPFVKNIDFVSKDEAAKYLSKEISEDFVAYLGFNPLPDALEIKLKKTLKYDEEITRFIKQIEKEPIIDQVIFDQYNVKNFVKIFTILGVTLLIVVLVLIFICFVFINNSIKIGLYSNRLKIKTMQLVGASPWFIKKPFLVNAIIRGWWSALLASAGISISVLFIRKYAGEYFTSDLLFYQFWIFGVVIISGIGISWVITNLVLNKFLRTSIHKLYNL